MILFQMSVTFIYLCVCVCMYVHMYVYMYVCGDTSVVARGQLAGLASLLPHVSPRNQTEVISLGDRCL